MILKLEQKKATIPTTSENPNMSDLIKMIFIIAPNTAWVELVYIHIA